jgi:hypothetical protein
MSDPLARAREAARQKRELEREYHALSHVNLEGYEPAQERKAAITDELERRWPGRWTRVAGSLLGSDMNDAEYAIARTWIDRRLAEHRAEG